MFEISIVKETEGYDEERKENKENESPDMSTRSVLTLVKE